MMRLMNPVAVKIMVPAIRGCFFNIKKLLWAFDYVYSTEGHGIRGRRCFLNRIEETYWEILGMI